MSRDEIRGHEEGITFFGHSPSEILDAFYSSGLAARGFSIAGRIVPHSACLIGQGSENEELFNGAKLYAGTFMRQSAI
jgi:hypothetical protein